MTTTITKRTHMIRKINAYLAVYSDELIADMASYYYFCSKEYCDLPARERRKLARVRFEKDRAAVTEKVLNILEGYGNRRSKIEELFSKYVVDSDAEYYADELVKKYDQLDK